MRRMSAISNVECSVTMVVSTVFLAPFMFFHQLILGVILEATLIWVLTILIRVAIRIFKLSRI